MISLNGSGWIMRDGTDPVPPPPPYPPMHPFGGD